MSKPVDLSAERIAAKAAWDNTPALRAEFAAEEHFIAWRLAAAAGRVKVLDQGTRPGFALPKTPAR